MKMKILVSLILVALMLGCAREFSDNADYLTEPPESFEDLMIQGWAAFESEHYATAIETFAAAAERKATLPEVYLGLGWSNIRDLNLEDGRIYLGSAISFAFLDAEHGAGIALDAQAGLAGIALMEGEYDQAISYVSAIIATDPAYEFSHDTEINLNALKRIRMIAAYYQGAYADAFQEVLELGLDMSSVIRETPATGSVTALTVVDSGFVIAPGDTLSSPWLSISAPGHNLELSDYVVLSGFSDNGDTLLTPLVTSFTRNNGWKIKYRLDDDTFLLSALSMTDASLVSSISLVNTQYFEATGQAVATPGSDLNGLLNISVYSDRQLIHVNTVAAVIDNEASYSVNNIDEGHNQFQIFGNPVFTTGQRVSVDYYYTDNFGIFLSELIDLVSTLE
jgi:tetratricopeptide (TPR) repeat protein